MVRISTLPHSFGSLMHTLGALSWTSPVLLWGAAFAVLPLIAHLLNRRARRRVIFPTIRFLLQSSAAQSRLFKLRRWLVLALRCAFVALLAAAFARPVWFANLNAERTSGRPSALVVVLDASASTAQDAGDGPLFETMRTSAARLLDALRPGQDVANVVFATDRPELAFPRLSPNLPALREQIQTRSSGQSRADLTRALAMAGELLINHMGPRRIVVVSDLQRSNWGDVDKIRRDGLIPFGTDLTFVNPSAPAPGNIALSAPRVAPPRPLIGQPSQCVVRIANHSAETREIPLTLKGPSLPETTQTVRIDPGEEREVAFPAVWKETGQEAIVFRIPADGLALDNRATLVVDPAARWPLLLVSSAAAEEPGSGLFFLSRALAPLGTTEDRFDVKTLRPENLRAADLAEAGVVFVETATAIDRDKLSLLAQHVRAGGSLVLFAGDPSTLPWLTRLDLIPGSVGLLPWIPGPLRDLTNVTDPVTIKGGKWRSRLLQEFDEQSQIALGQIRFHRIAAARRIAPDADVLLTFSDGSPALASRRYGAGQVVVAAFSADSASSDLGKFGAYVALMQSLARELRPGFERETIPRVGKTWVAARPIEDLDQTAAIRMIDPDGVSSPAAEVEVGGRRHVSLENPDKAGLHRFEKNGRTIAMVSVEIDPLESTLVRRDARELTSALAIGGQTARMENLADATASLSAPGNSLWHWLLALALVIAALEMACVIRWQR